MLATQLIDVMKEKMAEIEKEQVKIGAGNKTAAQRARKASIELRDICKKFRAVTLENEKKEECC